MEDNKLIIDLISDDKPLILIKNGKTFSSKDGPPKIDGDIYDLDYIDGQYILKPETKREIE